MLQRFWFLLPVFAAAASPAFAQTVEERIAARLATIDQATYETHRKCHGSRQGMHDLLVRIRPYVSEADAGKLDGYIEQYDPSDSFGRNQAFIEAEKLPLDAAKGEEAYQSGRLEWGAQALLPPGEQYAYLVKYGRQPEGCLEIWLKVDSVRHNIERVRDLRKQFPGWVPPPDQL